jgi:alkanesulfonate monooxygenase SsuD/methylene tetrahydromethanopterin reductase-like flavin-dependent oxidoreductase (luciferase family)
MEGSTLDCLAMTSFIAAHTQRIGLITAVHPGFFQPTAIAKWGATLDRLTEGRWAINVTSGWHLREFAMYGVDATDHDGTRARASSLKCCAARGSKSRSRMRDGTIAPMLCGSNRGRRHR